MDQNIYTLLRVEDDVHVLGGTLKLFFRELKQPLIPFKFFKKALNASSKCLIITYLLVNGRECKVRNQNSVKINSLIYKGTVKHVSLTVVPN